jgi:hypothetical protein
MAGEVITYFYVPMGILMVIQDSKGKVKSLTILDDERGEENFEKE